MKNTLRDEIYGELYLDAEANNKHLIVDCSLKGPYAAKIKVEVQSMTDIKAL